MAGLGSPPARGKGVGPDEARASAGFGSCNFSSFSAASAAEKIATIIDSIKFCTAYETGYYSADDVRRMGLAMLLLTIVVVSVTILYWGWLALLLTA
jgi:hypothetical protein